MQNLRSFYWYVEPGQACCRRLSGGPRRRNPDAARRLGIVGGLNFKLEQWQNSVDNKRFASGFYEVF
jgi:hypothetical protein